MSGQQARIESEYADIAGSVKTDHTSWLTEGANYFGSHTANRIVFPKEVVPFAGIFFLREDSVLMRVAVTANITLEDQPVDNVVIFGSGAPLTLSCGDLRFRIIESEGRYAVSFMTLEKH